MNNRAIPLICRHVTQPSFRYLREAGLCRPSVPCGICSLRDWACLSKRFCRLAISFVSLCWRHLSFRTRNAILTVRVKFSGDEAVEEAVDEAIEGPLLKSERPRSLLRRGLAMYASGVVERIAILAPPVCEFSRSKWARRNPPT